MKKHIITVTIISSLLMSNVSYATSTQAPETSNDREHTEELVGLSSGAILGAVIAGPVGAFIGALTGTIIGKSVGDESEITAQKSLLAQQEFALNEQNVKLADMDKQQQTLFAVQTELARIQAHQEQTLTELSIGMNVQFKTGSTQIAPLFQQQLDNVADMMTSMPDLHVNLMGYADRRGNDAFNQALSEQRLLEVTNYLIARGVDKTRLQGQAYGATSPMHAEQNFENDFFDRRVTLKLIAETAQLAAN